MELKYRPYHLPSPPDPVTSALHTGASVHTVVARAASAAGAHRTNSGTSFQAHPAQSPPPASTRTPPCPFVETIALPETPFGHRAVVDCSGALGLSGSILGAAEAAGPTADQESDRQEHCPGGAPSPKISQRRSDINDLPSAVVPMHSRHCALGRRLGGNVYQHLAGTVQNSVTVRVQENGHVTRSRRVRSIGLRRSTTV